MKLSIEQWVDKALKNSKKVYQDAAHTMSAEIQDNTPIDTTKAFRSWTASKGNRIAVNYVSREQAINGPIGDTIKPVTDSLMLGDQFNFANATPYIIPLEFGHSDQAPKGFFRIGKAKWNARVGEAVRRVR